MLMGVKVDHLHFLSHKLLAALGAPGTANMACTHEQSSQALCYPSLFLFKCVCHFDKALQDTQGASIPDNSEMSAVIGEIVNSLVGPEESVLVVARRVFKRLYEGVGSRWGSLQAPWHCQLVCMCGGPTSFCRTPLLLLSPAHFGQGNSRALQRALQGSHCCLNEYPASFILQNWQTRSQTNCLNTTCISKIITSSHPAEGAKYCRMLSYVTPYSSNWTSSLS